MSESSAAIGKILSDLVIDRRIPTSEVGTTNGGTTSKFGYTAQGIDSKYSSIGLSYPEDLMSSANNQYGNNCVIFYINVATDSRVLRGEQTQVVDGVTRDGRAAFVGEKYTGAQLATAAGLIGAGVGAVLGGGGGSKAGGAIGAAGVGAIQLNANNGDEPAGADKAPTFTRPQKRLKSAIALYIPNQLNARYSANWGEVDTQMVSAFAKGAKEIGAALSGDVSAKRTGGLVGEVLAAAAMQTAPGGAAAGVMAGLAANPKKEQAFNQVDFRTFTFEYQFSPKSSAEASNVMNIIRAFKYHMHPEFTTKDAFLYIYPSEFDITYYFKNKENLNIHRHTSCVLTEMNVNYTPNGLFTTFDDGMPTQINVTMTFKELLLLSKETIEKYM